MKVLWLCNIIIPYIAKCVGKTAPNVGGWLSGAFSELERKENVNIVYLYPGERFASKTIDNRCVAYEFKELNPKKFHEEQVGQFKSILEREKPDVIHIWGTEYPHSYAMTKAAEEAHQSNKIVISIQGMVSIYSQHYYAGLPHFVVNRFTLRDIIRKDSVYMGHANFLERGFYEKEALQKTNHVIGRTEWDKACVKLINNNITYHYCNETLRDSFYTDKWELENCERHSIFVSQASYPIKGFHFMIEALREIVKRYPEVQLYVPGIDMHKTSAFKAQKRSYYANYISNLISKNKLDANIHFLGSLSEAQMKKRFLKSHVFVCCSTIENSPNSLGEAMLLGVPSVVSDVGGVSSMLKNGIEGLIYPMDEPYMLAHYIMSVFSNDELAQTISNNAQVRAKTTHNREKNLNDLIYIYEGIIKNDR